VIRANHPGRTQLLEHRDSDVSVLTYVASELTLGPLRPPGNLRQVDGISDIQNLIGFDLFDPVSDSVDCSLILVRTLKI
jgi:hypothetical protein